MWNNIYFKSCKHWPLFFLSSDLLSPLPSLSASWELIMACCPWSSGTLVLACHGEIFTCYLASLSHIPKLFLTAEWQSSETILFPVVKFCSLLISVRLSGLSIPFALEQLK